MRRPRVPHLHEQLVVGFAALGTELGSGGPRCARVGCGEDHSRNILVLQLRGRQHGLRRLHQDASTAVLGLELPLEGVNQAVIGASPRADELVGDRRCLSNPDGPCTRHDDGGRGISEHLLPDRVGFAQTRVGSDHECVRRRAGSHRLDRQAQRRRSRPQRVGDVGREDVAAQPEHGSERGRRVLLNVRGRRAREEHRVDRRRVGACLQAVVGRLDGHRERVLVAPGHRPVTGNRGSAPQ